MQPCYTAAPVLADGVTDPVPDRLVVLPGEPLVAIRPLPPPRAARGAQRRRRDKRAQAARPTAAISGYRSDRYRDAALAGIKADLLRATEGQRHHALIAAATRMFELGSLSDGYVDRFIRDAAARAERSRHAARSIADEVDEVLEWARSQPPPRSGRAAA